MADPSTTQGAAPGVHTDRCIARAKVVRAALGFGTCSCHDPYDPSEASHG